MKRLWSTLLIGFIVISQLNAAEVGEKIRVGFIKEATEDQSSKGEIEAAMRLLGDFGQVEVKELPSAKLLKSKNILKDIDVVWYHRPDTGDISKMEKRLAKPIQSYVKNGGKLLLTLDAVRLLNEWKIEETPVQVQSTEVKDHGFGRKLGFHAYRSHPLFNGLNGGAYIWHSKEDHQVRKVGFFDKSLPQATEAKVVAIDWAYIHYHESSKLIWETPYGDGKILAVGAYMYFEPDNFSPKRLSMFTENCLRYLNGEFEGQTAMYWDYTPRKVAQRKVDADLKPIAQAQKWNMPTPVKEIKHQAIDGNFWDISGRRMFFFAKEKGGIEEVWTHPVMSLRDLYTSVYIGGEKIKLEDLKPNLITRPEALIREYIIGDVVLKEIITLSVEQEAGVVHYEWEGNIDQLETSFLSNLRYMWPYSSNATGNLYFDWNDESNALWITDPTQDLNTLIGFSQQPAQKELLHVEGIVEKDEDKKLEGVFVFDTKNTDAFEILIAAGSEGVEKTQQVYQSIAQNTNNLLASSNQYYHDLLAQMTNIKTPLEKFNDGYDWTIMRTDQFFVETPNIGKSLFAGYSGTRFGWNGNHKVNGRPGYAWYFGRDAIWSSFAINAYGNHAQVKDVLSTFIQWQNLDGKIYHELSSSGSVHYDAADATPMFINLAANYLKHSGDIEYVSEIWPSISKAIEFCLSTDTNRDHLIENTNVGHAWIEGGSLLGTHTTMYLAGMWAGTLKDAEYLSEAMGETVKSEFYNKEAKIVSNILNNQYWNPETDFYNFGKDKDGKFNPEKTIMPAVGIYYGQMNPQKAWQTTKEYSSNQFSSDWGVRILRKDSDLYNPRAYHYGSVWPLFTGWAALAEYKTLRGTQGFTHVMNNLNIYTGWTQGAILEVVHGEEYKPMGVTRHQCWSGTMILQPVMDGMLGFSPDALNNRMALTPQLPWDWNSLEVTKLHVGEQHLDVKMNKSRQEISYDFTSSQAGVVLDFSTVLPLATAVDGVFVNGKSHSFELDDKNENIMLSLESLKLNARDQIVIKYRGGIGVLPITEAAEKGAVSDKVKYIEELLDGDQYSLGLEGVSGKTDQITLYCNQEVTGLKGAKLLSHQDDKLILEVDFPESDMNYVYKEISVSINNQSMVSLK
ncbi:hypothetical protein AUTU_33090 [Aureibacter tunicatorum]|nr:hypothetical protein AUTU_33090 [Aureibacter tunicatorum]